MQNQNKLIARLAKCSRKLSIELDYMVMIDDIDILIAFEELIEEYIFNHSTIPINRYMISELKKILIDIGYAFPASTRHIRKNSFMPFRSFKYGGIMYKCTLPLYRWLNCWK